jgi:VWFA-related protein
MARSPSLPYILAAVVPAIFFFLLLFVTGSSPSPPTFHAQAPLVVVPVTVSDHRRNSIYGLTEADFELLDEGQPRPFHVDPPGGYRPGVSAVIVVQTSGLSGSALLKIQKIGSMIGGYITGEGSDAAVITAGEHVFLAQPPTPDPSATEAALRNLRPGAQSVGRDLDGVAMALDLLSKRDRNRRPIILLISETRDRGSIANLQDVLRRAQQENVTVWTVSYSAFVTPFTTSAADWQDSGGDKSFNLLAAVTEPARLAKGNMSNLLAQSTGGRHLSFARQKTLEDGLASIGKEVHSQYLLSFVPSAKPPTIHSIQIIVKGYPDAAVAYRPVYWKASP